MLWAWLAAPAAGAPSPAFRFAWLSDTHIGSQTAADDLRATVADINAMSNLSFVVISGDVTEYGSWQQFTNAKTILDQLRVPYHIIPGNHDTKWSESGATDFPRLWKADRFSFEHGGYRFIGLHQGPLMKMGDGHWAPQDVRWLEQTLQKSRQDQPIVFVTHYPIDDGIANWYVVLDLLKRYNTQVVLCGHGHSNRKLSFEGLPGVMGRSNLRAKNPVGGFNLVEVRDGAMTFYEKPPGDAAKPAWHSVSLEKHSFSPDATNGPRPDFSVNTRYASVRERWSRTTGFTIASTPAVWNDLAIVGDASGAIYAFALDNGKQRWKFKTQNAVYSTPAVGGEIVVVPSTDGIIYGLQARTGRLAWKHKTARPIVASPVATGDAVYLGASDGKFRCLDLRTGKLRWEYEGVKGFVETRPLLTDNRVVFGAWDEHLYALAADTGSLAWTWKGDKRGALLSPAACWPVEARGRIIIVAPDRQMTAIDSRTGDQIWRTGTYVVRESIGISEDGERFYVRAMNDLFYAFDAHSTSPRPLWETDGQFGYDINSAMLVEKEGTVFYGTKNGLLFALDSATGKVRWQHKIGTGVMNTVSPLSRNAVLVSNFDGAIALVEDTAH